MSRRILVAAPHPDDEVLGAGGTIARAAAEGDDVFVVIATRGYAPLLDEAMVARGREEAARAHRLLGVRETTYLDFPAACLDTVPHHQLNAGFDAAWNEIRPDVVYVPFASDLHIDHQRVFLSALVASRPHGSAAPRAVYAYEVLSETHWNAPYVAAPFVPNVFVDISSHLERKLEAFAIYASQARPSPHARSVDALRALAVHRGSLVGVAAAEAFVLLRQLV